MSTNEQFMRHFGVFLLGGDSSVQTQVSLSFDTVRDIAAKAWDEGQRSAVKPAIGVQRTVNPYRGE